MLNWDLCDVLTVCVCTNIICFYLWPSVCAWQAAVNRLAVFCRNSSYYKCELFWQLLQMRAILTAITNASYFDSYYKCELFWQPLQIFILIKLLSLIQNKSMCNCTPHKIYYLNFNWNDSRISVFIKYLCQMITKIFRSCHRERFVLCVYEISIMNH